MIIEFRGVNRGDAIWFVVPAIYLLFEVLVITVLLSVLPKIFTRVVVALTVIFLAVDMFTLAMYRSVFDKGMFQVLLDTNIQEATEYLGDFSGAMISKIFFAVPVAIILVAIFKLGVWLLDRLFSRSAWFVRCMMIIFAICFTMIIPFSNVDYFLTRNPCSIIRISSLVPRALNETREYKKIYESIDAAQIEITRNDNDLPWVVFILGESTTRNHMSLYNYDKPTTPNLQRRFAQGELIFFTDCVSAATETMPACQRLFTFFRNGGLSDKPWYQYTNIFDILKAAGCHTAWLSNQEVTGIYGNVPRAFADRCDEKKFTTIHDTETYVYEYDEKILPLLDESLQKNSSAKNFYVLHLLGTHLNYRARYPDEFDIFRADDEPAKNPVHRKFQAMYDNAVLYNDFVVDEIIKRFEDKDALIIYVSDHGEIIFDDGINLGHGQMTGINNKWQFEIPMLFWFSDTCKKNHPELVQKISAAKDRPFMTDDMIHALLDFLKISTADFDSRKSLFSEDFDDTRRRIYDGMEYIDGKLIPAGD